MILFEWRGFLNLDEPRFTLIPFDDQIKVTSKVDLIKDGNKSSTKGNNI